MPKSDGLTKRQRQRLLLSILWKHPHNKPELEVLINALSEGGKKIVQRTITRDIADIRGYFGDEDSIEYKDRVGFVVDPQLIGHMPVALLANDELTGLLGYKSLPIDTLVKCLTTKTGEPNNDK